MAIRSDLRVLKWHPEIIARTIHFQIAANLQATQKQISEKEVQHLQKLSSSATAA